MHFYVRPIYFREITLSDLYQFLKLKTVRGRERKERKHWRMKLRSYFRPFSKRGKIDLRRTRSRAKQG